MLRDDVDLWIVVRRAEESDRSALNGEFALHRRRCEIERVRSTIGSQYALEREPDGVPARLAADGEAALLFRASHVERAAELDVRLARLEPYLVPENDLHVFETEVLYESGWRVRYDLPCAGVARIDDLEDLIAAQIDHLLPQQIALGQVHFATVDAERTGERRIVHRSDEPQRVLGRDVERRQRAPIERVKVVRRQRDVEPRRVPFRVIHESAKCDV